MLHNTTPMHIYIYTYVCVQNIHIYDRMYTELLSGKVPFYWSSEEWVKTRLLNFIEYNTHKE